MKIMKVKVTFTEEALGTASANPDIYKDYIGTKAPDAKSLEEEVMAIGEDAVIERAMTVFPRNAEGQPCMWDYQWKGFFKDACKALRKINGTECKKVTAYKQVIDKLIFPQPRMIPINVNGEMGICQRPLRGNTPQGETISLAISETVPAGSTVEFEIKLYDDSHEKWVKEMFEYGADGGTLQWRNSGKGRFTVEYLSIEKI